MSRPQSRKRTCADNCPQDGSPKDKIKSGHRARKSSNFPPPEYWDNLSKVWLTPRALRELHRRNSARPAPAPEVPAAPPTDLCRFARGGGPNLSRLRQYRRPDRTMRSSPGEKPGKPATPPTPRRSTAYDKNFEQDLNDHGVYLHSRKSEPKNLPDLSERRRSLSLSRVSKDHLRRLRKDHEKLNSEADVLREILPVITGKADFYSAGDTLFNNLESITSKATVDPKPDLYDGAFPEDVNQQVRRDLNRLIVPSTDLKRPVAPNFFLEAKGPSPAGGVAKRQAGLDGATGARAMHALQNYGAKEPVYDGIPYAYSSTYHGETGTLILYAHHISPPGAPGERPSYHMSLIDAWTLLNIDNFRQGVTQFRNARDLAREHRDKFIAAANAKSRQHGADKSQEAKARGEAESRVAAEAGDAAAEDVAPEDVAPGDATPDNIATEDAAPGDAAPGDAAPGDAARDNTAAEDAAPGNAVPGDGAPGDAGADNKKQQESSGSRAVDSGEVDVGSEAAVERSRAAASVDHAAEGPTLPQDSHDEKAKKPSQNSAPAGPKATTGLATGSASRTEAESQMGLKRKRLETHSPPPPSGLKPHDLKDESSKRTRRSE